MLTLSILIPLLASLGLFVWSDVTKEKARLVALGASALSFLCLIIVLFTHHHNVNILDTDRYLHDAHIAASTPAPKQRPSSRSPKSAGSTLSVSPGGWASTACRSPFP